MNTAPADRTERGRFAPGNRVSCLGWAGLVEKRFKGDEQAAKQWLIRLGKFAYARQAGGFTPAMRRRMQRTFTHPGTPEEYLECQAMIGRTIPGDVDFYHDHTGHLEDEPGYSESRTPFLW